MKKTINSKVNCPMSTILDTVKDFEKQVNCPLNSVKNRTILEKILYWIKVNPVLSVISILIAISSLGIAIYNTWWTPNYSKELNETINSTIQSYEKYKPVDIPISIGYLGKDAREAELLVDFQKEFDLYKTQLQTICANESSNQDIIYFLQQLLAIQALTYESDTINDIIFKLFDLYENEGITGEKEASDFSNKKVCEVNAMFYRVYDFKDKTGKLKETDTSKVKESLNNNDIEESERHLSELLSNTNQKIKIQQAFYAEFFVFTSIRLKEILKNNKLIKLFGKEELTHDDDK